MLSLEKRGLPGWLTLPRVLRKEEAAAPADGADRSSAVIKRDGACEFACDGAFLEPV
jgi:hypothetical protein